MTDAHGVLVYEKRKGKWVGECDCRLQFRTATEAELTRQFYDHCGSKPLVRMAANWSAYGG